MAEESETQESGIPAGAGGAAATALALGVATQNARVAAQAETFLKEQTRLTQLQAQELSHELSLRHWSLWVRHASGLLKLALELSAGLLLLFVVTSIGVMVWNAAHADGLVIESFSVPPDLASRGLTGQVVATQMLDNLSALEAQNNSVRAPSSYANNWGDDIKVEIPDTGISIGEAYRFLRGWLGHETHITGEIVRTATGVAITARAGTEAGKRIAGSEADFDALLQQATEAVYANTQPYRYAVTLTNEGKMAQAEAFFVDAARTQPPAERAWANSGVINVLIGQHRMVEAAEAGQAAVAIDPGFAFGWYKLQRPTSNLGRAEASLAAGHTALRLLDDRSATHDLRPEAVPTTRQNAVLLINDLLGDYSDFIAQDLARYPTFAKFTDPARQVQDILVRPGSSMLVVIMDATDYAQHLILNHDLTNVRRFVAERPGYIAAVRAATTNQHDIRGEANVEATTHAFRGVEMYLASATQDWAQVVQAASVLDAEEPGLNAAYASGGLYPPTTIWPVRAYAEARMGDFSAAHAWIDRTPSDCDPCLRTRAQIDAAQKNNGGADYWFATAVRKAPSIPFAYADWGQALLERGDPDGAIAKFTLANQKGPKFADPLELWGEALMAKNRSDLALAKFAEAEKYAPNWGRLHLKWGEALGYAGRKNEAQKQFALAAGLDLSSADRAELAKVRG